MRWTCCAQSTSCDAITAAVGSPRADSSANVGPDKTANDFSLSPRTDDVISDIRSSVSFSIPFVPETTVTACEIESRTCRSTAR